MPDPEVERLRDAIRQHRDARGDDRCWMDDEELYKVLPEGYTPPARDTTVELASCEQYIACRHNPATEYVSPQRRIEQLESTVRQFCETAGGVLNYGMGRAFKEGQDYWVGRFDETIDALSKLREVLGK